MKYFKVYYEWHTRPRWRKGRLAKCSVVFAVEEERQLHLMILRDGQKRFPRHKWKAVSWQELPSPTTS